MRIVIVGGGPAGLYFGLLMKARHRDYTIEIFERDGPSDTFGWGIVFSDQTFSYLRDRDHPSYRQIIGCCETWDNLEVVHGDERISIHGNKFSGISRVTFLNVLQERCRELGVELHFKSAVTALDQLGGYDLLVGADGVGSLVRSTYAEHFQPELELRRNKYIWLGTHQRFEGLTLTFREQEGGVYAAHSYKFSPTTSTFIVECPPETWQRAGLGELSDSETRKFLAGVFRDDLGGERLLSNRYVKWQQFPLIRNRRWSFQNVVLLGDALHTAHFSIGSGTKLALEDAISLFECFETQQQRILPALEQFEAARKPVIEDYQSAAYASLLMFESIPELMELDPLELAYRLMTRSGRIDHEKLRRRDPEFIARYEHFKAAQPMA